MQKILTGAIIASSKDKGVTISLFNLIESCRVDDEKIRVVVWYTGGSVHAYQGGSFLNALDDDPIEYKLSADDLKKFNEKLGTILSIYPWTTANVKKFSGELGVKREDITDENLEKLLYRLLGYGEPR